MSIIQQIAQTTSAQMFEHARKREAIMRKENFATLPSYEVLSNDFINQFEVLCVHKAGHNTVVYFSFISQI